jgi:NAD(P)-dependent dehydrogenase (short-subunit alcohol dehydrogenase family)
MQSRTRITTPFSRTSTPDDVYDPWLAYGRSKTANVLFAIEAARRWAPDGIAANALMPGGIRTGLQRYQVENITPEIQAVFDVSASLLHR